MARRPPPLPPRRTPAVVELPPLPVRRRVPDLPSRPVRRVTESQTLDRILEPRQTRPPPPPPRALTEPPPVPLHSKPSLQTIVSHGEPGSCLLCRDFSIVDSHAACFSRQQVSSIASLAAQLCDPFPTKTDKARAIYTWLHHNVEYDVDAFFGDRVRGKTPEETLTSGLAVCQGYAELFEALAAHAGLEAIVVSGHGKGYGFSQIRIGDPIPPKKVDGHAWNAVRIDTGWHLVDACWGAGNVGGPGQYSKHFKPKYFVSSPVEFGVDHFPSDSEMQLAPPRTWEQYITNDYKPLPPVFFGADGLRDFSRAKTLPPYLKITQEGWYKFHFEKVCEHWKVDPRKELLLLVNVQGDTEQRRGSVSAKGSRIYPVVPESRGWYANAFVPRGATQVVAYFLTAFGDIPVEGLTAAQFFQRWGKVSSSYSGFAKWGVEIS